jgi:hypothetical protein
LGLRAFGRNVKSVGHVGSRDGPQCDSCKEKFFG